MPIVTFSGAISFIRRCI